MVIALTVVVGLAGLAAWSEARRWWASPHVLARLGTSAPPRTAPAALRRAVERAGVEIDPRSLLDLWIAAAAIVAAATPFVAGAPVALVVVLIGPPAALALGRNRAARIRAAQLPLALDAIAGAMRGGASLATAVAEAASIGGPIGREFAEIARRCRNGLDIRSAVEQWAKGDPDTALAGASLTMAASVGGPAADALESAASSLRQRASAAEEVAALSVQARLSAVVLSAAPVGFTFLLATVDPGSARFLLRTPAGWACIAVGVSLDALGGWWMHRLVRRAS